jgi:hypothetical protein
MSDGPEWFAPKRYGYGAGPPITWQGRLLMIAFVAVTIGVGFWFATRPLVAFAILTPLIILFTIGAARTTRGGWRWRWGEKE